MIEDRPLEEVIVYAARRSAAHAMADLARFYVGVGAGLYFEGQRPEPDATHLAKLYARVDGCYRQCDRLGIDFHKHIADDTLDVLLEDRAVSDEAREFVSGFVTVARSHFDTIHTEIAREEAHVTAIAEAKIAARLAVGDPLEDNGDSDYAEARCYVDAMALRNGHARLTELRERNRLMLRAAAHAA